MSLLETWDWSLWCVPGKSDPRLDFVAAHAPAPHIDRQEAPADCNVRVPLAVAAVREMGNLSVKIPHCRETGCYSTHQRCLVHLSQAFHFVSCLQRAFILSLLIAAYALQHLFRCFSGHLIQR